MKKKIVKIVITVLVTAIIAVGICVLINKDSIFREKSSKATIYKNIEFKDKLELEAGKEFKVEDFIERVIGGELIYDEKKVKEIDTKKIGDLSINLEVKDANNEKQEFELKIKVVDTTKPEIENENDKITITVGDKVDLLKGVTAKDNIDGELDIKVEGKYDTDKEGEYKLKYIAEDKSGNKTEKEFTLQVNKKVEKPTSNNSTKTNNKSSSSNSSNSNSNSKTSSSSNTNSSNNTNKSEGYNVSGQGLLSLVNKAREKEGVGKLSWSGELERAAKIRAKELATSYSHTRPDGSLCFTVSSSAFAENIAWGQTSVNSVNTSWTNSPGHYQNMTDESYESMGAAGYVKNGKYYWVELFGY